MSNQLLDEAELLLLKQWGEARLLEQSMERVRQKYAALFEQVVAAVTEAHPDLDSHKVFVTQFWSKGSVGFGRKAWPDGDTYNLPGFWLHNLRLEVLADEDEPAPAATVWIPPKAFKKIATDAAGVRQQLLVAAADLLTKDEYERHLRQDGGGRALLHFAMPPKREVLNLFKAGDGEGLVEWAVGQFDVMARFLPLMDRILGDPSARG
ncbi:MAG: hypothetical protein JWO31_3554 [Phycisphaerales bacterium]|nr:hypothetical protein [Phycisphaerales bacterium]